MSTWKLALWKVALRLEQAYRASHLTPREWQLPVDDWHESLASLQRLQLVEQRQWRAAASQQRESLACDLERVGYQLDHLISSLRSVSPTSWLPTAALLYAEMAAITAQFERWELDDDELAVVTEPVTLEGIDLGSFEIRLKLDHPAGTESYRVVALTPNPAASSTATTHPHVNDEHLCPGEGRASIETALQQGRLSDFFTIVERILQTYSRDNAYVELRHWQGMPCHDCDVKLDEDECYSCHGCEHTLCGDCSLACNQCGSGYCDSCLARCSRCDEPICSRCLERCARCHDAVCRACLDDNICTPCEEELADEDANETASTEVSQPAV